MSRSRRAGLGASPGVTSYSNDDLRRRIIFDHLVGHIEVLADGLPFDRFALGDRDLSVEQQAIVVAVTEGDQLVSGVVGLELELGDLGLEDAEHVGGVRGIDGKGSVNVHASLYVRSLFRP